MATPSRIELGDRQGYDGDERGTQVYRKMHNELLVFVFISMNVDNQPQTGWDKALWNMLRKQRDNKGGKKKALLGYMLKLILTTSKIRL